MDEQDRNDLKAVVVQVVKPLSDGLDAVEAKASSNEWDRGVRRLSDGTVVPLGNPRGTRGLGQGTAPAHVRSRGEQAYSFERLLKSLLTNDPGGAAGARVLAPARAVRLPEHAQRGAGAGPQAERRTRGSECRKSGLAVARSCDLTWGR